MTKRGLIFFSLLCGIAFFLGVFAGFIYGGGDKTKISEANNTEINVLANPTKTPPTPSPTPSPTPDSIEEVQYLLSLSDDSSISVYNISADGETTFLYKKEINVLNLRQEDYLKLGAGIIVDSENEARALLEDFTN